ncbi:hypothetical protein ACVW0Y_002607 [Pseudomonas sp. TE3786]
MKNVLNLLSAAAVVVAGAYAAATTSVSAAEAVQAATQASHSEMLNKPLTEPQWAESPFMQPEPQMASNQATPAGDVLRGAQWQNVSDDVESAHVPKAENQRWVF